jgi:hypothetical protein
MVEEKDDEEEASYRAVKQYVGRVSVDKRRKLKANRGLSIIIMGELRVS